MLQWIELHLKRVGGIFSHMCSEILTGYTRVLFHPVSCGASFVLVNSGPLPSHGSCFEQHPSDAVMHKAPPTSQLLSPPSYFDWRNNADCLPPSGTDWVEGGVIKGQSTHNPPPVPHTITLLMFWKNFTLALLERLLSAFPSEDSQKEKSEEG